MLGNKKAAPGTGNNFGIRSSQRGISWKPCRCLNPKISISVAARFEIIGNNVRLIFWPGVISSERDWIQ